jgi:hypothetical protein
MHFSALVLLALALALALSSPVSSLVVPRQQPPSGWATDYLEPYSQYHQRYLDLGCQKKHNDQQFFNDCCHPLLATEKLDTARPAKCIPPTTTTPTLSLTTDGDDDCDDGDDTSAPPAPSPSPTSTHVDPPKDTPKPKAATTHISSADTPKPTLPATTPDTGSDAETGGHATFFYQNGVAGACGTVHKDTDFVAAMDYRRYGNLSVKSPLCGQKVKITNTENGKTVTVVVADACPTCDSKNSIDLSEGAFKEIAALSEGYVPIKWSFL